LAKIETQSDGTAIVKLSEPITVNDLEINRATIPKLKGRHLFGAPPLTSIGMILQWAANVVEPKGALEEMSTEDAVQVGDFLFERLHQRRSTGAAPSAESAATSDGAKPSS